MTPTSKRILFRLSKPPYGTAYAREALDAILAAAAFEQKVSVLFVGDATYQLVKNQKPEQIQQKNFMAALGMLSLYGVHEVFADAQALRTRGLDHAQLLLPVTALEAAEIHSLTLNQDCIISF
jgi:tRNA 2-thiouridine synthesizing protein C